jgi:hypothetical protein
MSKSRLYVEGQIPIHAEYLRAGLTQTDQGPYQSMSVFPGYEVLVSGGHAWPPPRGYSHADIGGDYSIRRCRSIPEPYWGEMYRWIGSPGPTAPNVYWKGYSIPTAAYTGPLGPADPPSLVSPGTMLAKGTEGWNRYKPTASRGGLDQAIGEAHEIPSVTKIKDLRTAMLNMKHNAGWHRALGKAVGSNYLNYVFGWVPLINDLKDLAQNSLLLESRIRQLFKDNDKPVRRSGPVGSTNEATMEQSDDYFGGSAYPWLGFGSYEYPLKYSKHIQTKTDFHFSGRFRYHLVDPRTYSGPIDYQIKPREAYQLQRILFGAEVTPATLYQLMPWSWLIDWVVPIGQIIDNVVNDPVDNLVADYAYISAHQTVTYHDTVSGTFKNGRPFTCGSQVFKESKQRTGASPYGFGLSYTGFSLKQLAILAALGLSRKL